MQLTRRTIAITAILALGAVAHAGILFEESFRNYADNAPGVTPDNGFSVGNDPIWNSAFELNARAKTPSNVFVDDIPLPKDNRFDVLVTFRILNSTMPKKADPKKEGDKDVPGVASSFDIVFRDAKGKTLKVTVAADRIAGAERPFLANWKWEELAIKANGKTADVFVTSDRLFRKVATLALDATFERVNFAATPGKEFSLRDIVVRTPEGLRGHPVETHFASFKSLSQPIPGAQVATGTETNVIPQKPMAGVRFIPGQPKEGQTLFAVKWSDGTETTYPVSIQPVFHTLLAPLGDQPKGTKLTLPDGAVDIKGLARQCVRPDLRPFCSSYYIVPQGIDVLRDWNRLPPASRHPLDVNFERAPDGTTRVFVDGSFVTTLAIKDKPDVTVSEIAFRPAKGVSYALQPGGEPYGSWRFLPLDLSKNPRAKAFVDAQYADGLAAGLKDFDGVPIIVAEPRDSADVAICKEGMGNWALEVEEYHGRSPAAGFPSAIHYRVPPADYARAHILFALDPDRSKDAILTLSLGYYMHNGSGGNMVAQTVVEVKNGKLPIGCREVGRIKRGNAEIPVCYMAVEIDTGSVVDIAARRGYFDFEFMGKSWENFEQIDRTTKPDPHSNSAFNLFGITLEKAPVIVDFRQDQPANVFTEDEKDRRTTVSLKAAADKVAGSVTWIAKDVRGRPVFSGEKPFSFAKAGETNSFPIALGDETPRGFYTLDITVRDSAGAPFFTHAARFAVLPPAGRKVGKVASPYATWWFNSHGAPGDPWLGGTIMKKAGIRKASWNTPNAEMCATYDITGVGSISAPNARDFDYATGKFKGGQVPDPTDPEPNPKKKRQLTLDGEAMFVHKVKSQIDGHVKNGRFVDHMLIWHESAPGYGIPEELLNLPVPATPDKDKDIAKYVNEVGRLMRKHFPNIKLQFGNSSASIGAAVRPLRAGANPAYYDYMGFESPSQVIKPEKLQEVGLQGMRITLDIAEKLAKRPVKGNGSWEYTYRCERDMGEQQHAEWYARDALISLANDFFLVSPGILFDCSTGYYDSLWGASGILQRGPYGYPKRAYVAYAVLTKCLDGVKFVRQIDTGSTTVYAVEFKRIDGKTATALWAARGEVDFLVDSPSTGTWTEMYGAEYAIPAGKSVVSGGTAPVYVVTEKPLNGVSIKERRFPKEMEIAMPAAVADRLDDVRDVYLEPDPQLETTHTSYLPILKPGTFTLAQANDLEKGPCIEVTLDTATDPYRSKYITEYTTIRFKEPKPIPGTPSVIGVWVKGNSNWGQIRFEIEDARGEVFKNLSTGRSWGCDIMDWPGNLCVDFDGWGYVYQSIVPNKLVNDHSPGPFSEQWVSEGHGDKTIQFPIKVRAITVGMNRTKLDLLDFKASAPSIRIRDVGGRAE